MLCDARYQLFGCLIIAHDTGHDAVDEDEQREALEREEHIEERIEVSVPEHFCEALVLLLSFSGLLFEVLASAGVAAESKLNSHHDVVVVTGEHQDGIDFGHVVSEDAFELHHQCVRLEFVRVGADLPIHQHYFFVGELQLQDQVVGHALAHGYITQQLYPTGPGTSPRSDPRP